MNTELSAKRLELLHEFLPTATIMAALINPAAASGEPVARELQAASHVLGLEVLPGRVHLLLGVDPQFGIHRLVKLIKGRSSRLLRQEFAWLRSRLPTLWTNSYFVATTGGAPLEKVKQYIEQQKRSER